MRLFRGCTYVSGSRTVAYWREREGFGSAARAHTRTGEGGGREWLGCYERTKYRTDERNLPPPPPMQGWGGGVGELGNGVPDGIPNGTISHRIVIPRRAAMGDGDPRGADDVVGIFRR